MTESISNTRLNEWLVGVGSVTERSRSPQVIAKASTGSSFCHRLGRIAKKIFKGLLNTATFPKRFFGAKDWSMPGLGLRAPLIGFRKLIFREPDYSVKRAVFGEGFQRQATMLSSENVKQYIKYAAACSGVHSGEKKWVSCYGMKTFVPSVLPEGVESKGDYFFDLKTGCKMMVAYDDDELVVSLGAFRSQKGVVDEELEGSVDSMHRWGAFGGWFGLQPQIYDRADQMLQAVLACDEMKGKQLTLAGHCFGGSIAQYVALKNGKDAVCLNSWPIGAGLQESVGYKSLREAEANIRQISSKGDFVSDNTAWAVVDRITSLIGLRNPGNFGKRYHLPRIYENSGDNHCYIMASMMDLAGRHYRDVPFHLDAEDPLLHQERPFQV